MPSERPFCCQSKHFVHLLPQSIASDAYVTRQEQLITSCLTILTPATCCLRCIGQDFGRCTRPHKYAICFPAAKHTIYQYIFQHMCAPSSNTCTWQVGNKRLLGLGAYACHAQGPIPAAESGPPSHPAARSQHMLCQHFCTCRLPMSSNQTHDRLLSLLHGHAFAHHLSCVGGNKPLSRPLPDCSTLCLPQEAGSESGIRSYVLLTIQLP